MLGALRANSEQDARVHGARARYVLGFSQQLDFVSTQLPSEQL